MWEKLVLQPHQKKKKKKKSSSSCTAYSISALNEFQLPRYYELKSTKIVLKCFIWEYAFLKLIQAYDCLNELVACMKDYMKHSLSWNAFKPSLQSAIHTNETECHISSSKFPGTYDHYLTYFFFCYICFCISHSFTILKFWLKYCYFIAGAYLRCISSLTYVTMWHFLSFKLIFKYIFFAHLWGSNQ